MFRRPVDLDVFHLRLGAGALWQRHRENAVLERGFDLVFLDLDSERDLPFEPAIEKLAELTVLVFDFGLLFAADDQGAVADQKVDIFFSRPGSSAET
jgi:hypothetical protein